MDAITSTGAAIGHREAAQAQQALGTLMVKAATESAVTQLQAVSDAVESTRAMMDAMQGRGTQLNLTV